MKKFVKIMALCLAMGIMVMSLTGCDTIEKDKRIKELETEIEEQKLYYEQEITELEEQFNNRQITEKKVTTSLQTVDGELVPKFVTIDGNYVFPDTLDVQGSTVDAAKTFIQVGSRFKFTPSNNWIVKLGGSQIDLQHPIGVYGSIKALTVSDILPIESINEELKSFYSQWTTTSVSYKKVFIDDRNVGMLSYATTTFNDKPTGVVNGIGTSVGFLIAIVLMAGIREKIEYNDVPEAFKGTPIVLVTAGLMAIAFFGFSGLIQEGKSMTGIIIAAVVVGGVRLQILQRVLDDAAVACCGSQSEGILFALFEHIL